MFRRSFRFVAVFAAALAVVPFLPLYVERTFVRLFLVSGAAGDTVEWGWALRTLSGFWSDYRYFQPEQRPALWLCVNLALAVTYAVLIAFIVNYLLVRVSGFKSGRPQR
ncbi:MAG: hypothetical protein ACJ754_03635 [Pyrinomonadaceae bacterium]